MYVFNGHLANEHKPIGIHHCCMLILNSDNRAVGHWVENLQMIIQSSFLRLLNVQKK